MKKFLIVLVLLGAGFSVSAQGFYFDIGIGGGMARTKVDEIDVLDLFKLIDPDFKSLAADVGFKIGYGPIAGIPLYVVFDFDGTGDRLYNDSDWIQFNSYLLGPGLVFYPIRFMQIASSFGYSFTASTSSIDDFPSYGSKGGIAGNVSVALDLGGHRHGCLIGVKYFGAVNTIKATDEKEKMSAINFFIRYAFRQKNKRN
jgi:hypothetical protein